jgi:hypothetical protein
MVGGEAVIRDVSLLRLVKQLSRRQINRDRDRLDAFFRGRR